MKILIWIAFLAIPSIVITLLGNIGIMLGGIPTMLLYGACFYAARTLCGNAKADVQKFEQEARDRGKTPMEYAKTKFNPTLLESCELSKYNKVEFTKQLKHYSNIGYITSAEANILRYLFLGELR